MRLVLFWFRQRCRARRTLAAIGQRPVVSHGFARGVPPTAIEGEKATTTSSADRRDARGESQCAPVRAAPVPAATTMPPGRAAANSPHSALKADVPRDETRARRDAGPFAFVTRGARINDFFVNQLANFARRSRNNHSEFIAPPRISFMREIRPRRGLFSN